MKYATTTSHKSTRGFVVVEYGADESGRMSPVCRLKRCLHSLVGVGGECRIQKAGRRERKTGPRHALTRLRCTTHRVSFVLYPLGHIPYGRVAVVEQSAGSPKPESRDDVVSAAAAWCAGRRWEEELIEDDPGPVRRTQWRRINQLAQRLGLDSKKVDSRILVGDTGLDFLLHRQDMEALRSRLACIVRLRLLSREECKSYIRHRLEISGAREEILDQSAMEAIYDYTRGNIRAIDILCRTALYIAAFKRIDTIDAGIVTIARKKLP